MTEIEVIYAVLAGILAILILGAAVRYAWLEEHVRP
jgi:hypothetical protein